MTNETAWTRDSFIQLSSAYDFRSQDNRPDWDALFEEARVRMAQLKMGVREVRLPERSPAGRAPQRTKHHQWPAARNGPGTSRGRYAQEAKAEGPA